MATHSGDSRNTNRTFFIGRENGQQDKAGKPYWFEYTPNPLPGEKVERRINGEGEEKLYTMYSAIDGHLVDVYKGSKTFDATREAQQWLMLTLQDGEETYNVEVGRMDSRWSIDCMKRLLDLMFDPALKIRLAPIASTDRETGKQNMFISAYSGPDKLIASKDADHLKDIPQPTVVTLRGKQEYDFTEVAEWLFEQIRLKVLPKLSAPTQAGAPQYTDQPIRSARPSDAASRMEPAEIEVPTANPALDAPMPDNDLPF